MIITKILQILYTNCLYLFGVTTAILALYLAVNTISNDYAKDDNKIFRATKLLLSGKTDLGKFAVSLPLVYQYQWQAYIRSHGIYPSEIFRFIPHKARQRLMILSGLSVVACLMVAVYSIYNNLLNSAEVFVPLALSVGFIVIGVLIRAVNKLKASKSSKSFERFTSVLDAHFGNDFDFDGVNDNSREQTNELIKKVNFFKRNGVPAQSAEKIARLLSQEKLTSPRTLEQQRRLNTALNGLVQVLTRTNMDTNLNNAENAEHADRILPQDPATLQAIDELNRALKAKEEPKRSVDFIQSFVDGITNNIGDKSTEKENTAQFKTATNVPNCPSNAQNSSFESGADKMNANVQGEPLEEHIPQVCVKPVQPMDVPMPVVRDNASESIKKGLVS